MVVSGFGEMYLPASCSGVGASSRYVPASSVVCQGRKGVIMGNIIWLIIMIPCSLLFTGIGIYAWKKKKPMWFYSGSTVRVEEIVDVVAYNKANGVMWITYSLVFWLSTVMGFFYMATAGIVLMVGCLGGIPLLGVAYNRIYRKYKR